MAAGARARLPLSQARIVDAALRFVDRHGLEALSMRRLGSALRVEAMSLYKHVPSKAALLELVAERVLADAAAPVPGPWEDRVRHFARDLRRLALAHPHAFALIATRMPSSPRTLVPIESLLASLRDAGLSDAATTRHFWAVLAYLTGALLAETSARLGQGGAPFDSRSPLDPALFPNLLRLGDAIGDCDFATEYENGIAIAISAIRAAASRGD